MGRLRSTLGVATALAGAGLAVGCGGDGAGGAPEAARGAAAPAAIAPDPGLDGAREAARRYLDALARRDVRAVCAAWAPRVWHAVDARTSRSCRQAVSESFAGPLSDIAWRGMDATIVGAAPDDGFARVDVRERHRYAGHGPLLVDDALWLRRSAGRWELLKPGAALAAIRYADELPYGEAWADPPVRPGEARRPFAPRSGAPCAPTARATPDAARDVEGVRGGLRGGNGAYDLRDATVARGADGSLCLQLRTAAPLRAATAIDVALVQELPDGGLRFLSASVRLAGGGRIVVAGEPRATAASPAPDVVQVAFEPGSVSPGGSVRVQAELASSQLEEALVPRPLQVVDRLRGTAR